jgi:hypothetical protein
MWITMKLIWEAPDLAPPTPTAHMRIWQRLLGISTIEQKPIDSNTETRRVEGVSRADCSKPAEKIPPQENIHLESLRNHARSTRPPTNLESKLHDR